MYPVVEARHPEIEALCRSLNVRRLDVFGSVVDGSFDPGSRDVDVLVEFDIRPGFDYVGTYFDLKEGLEKLFGRPVDVVMASSIRNPYVRERAVQTRKPLYVAGPLNLVELAAHPTPEDVIARARDRARSLGRTMTVESIMAARDADQA